MSQSKLSKLDKLKNRLEDSKMKRADLNETIKQLESQILEEESKEFKSVLETIDLSFEDAIKFLKTQKNLISISEETTEKESEVEKGGNYESI